MNNVAKNLLMALALWSFHLNSVAASQSLQQFVDEHPKIESSHKVIACAAGGKEVSMGDEQFPLSIYFYPVPGATNFHYFESSSANINARDFSKYRLAAVELAPVFNGYLRRFKHGPVTNEVWGVVTYQVNDRLVLSNPIRIKLTTKPTQMANELVNIEAGVTEPKFRWQDGTLKENAIYFQVVSDAAGNLISGTYTEEKHFQFYNLSNVVVNIHDVRPPPTLQTNTTYTFTLMGVSEDNWVNLMAQKPFTTGK